MIRKISSGVLVNVTPYVEGVSKAAANRRVAGIVEKYDPNYVYSVVIGIQGDTFNENHDFWPWEDTLLAPHKTLHLAHQYQSWKGKPNCYQHINRGPQDHYGYVVDTWHTEPKDVLMVLATDRRANPDLVRAIEAGTINSVSMGCNVAMSKCSVCGNIAYTPKDYCQHIKWQKGRHLPVNDGLNYYPGAKIAASTPLVYCGEICYDITGVEMSWVDNPAFPNCLRQDKGELNIVIPQDRVAMVADKYIKSNDATLKSAGRALKKAASKKDMTNDEANALLRLLNALRG
jgi:hypothetical protein